MIEGKCTYLAQVAIPVEKFEELVRDSEKLRAVRAVLEKYPTSSMSEVNAIVRPGEVS